MIKEPKKAQALNKVAECLYRSSNGQYFALIKVCGKQIKRSLKTTDRQLANRRLKDLRDKAQRVQGSETKNILFEELAKTWLQAQSADLKPASLDRRSVAIKGLAPYFGKKAVRSIGYSDIERWKIGRGSKISARSHNIELETLSLLMRYAIDKGITLDNPVEKFKRRIQAHHVAIAPTRSQYSELVKTLRESRAYESGASDFVEFLACSGNRVGEAREIRLRDIHFDQKRLTITGGEIGNKNHKERSIPLFPNLEAVVIRIIENRKLSAPGEKLFEILSPRGAMELACKRAGLPHFNVHSLRHFFATNAIEAGVNFKTLGDWLGHSDGGILAAKTYGHLRQEFSEEMALKMTFEAAVQS